LPENLPRIWANRLTPSSPTQLQVQLPSIFVAIAYTSLLSVDNLNLLFAALEELFAAIDFAPLPPNVFLTILEYVVLLIDNNMFP
jgi:hypothetical protein